VSSLPWLSRRSGMMWFHMRVPVFLACRIGKRAITRSLRTRDLETARIRLYGISMLVAGAVQEIRRNLAELSDADCRRILDAALTRGVALFERNLACSDPASDFNIDREIARQEGRLATLRAALRTNALSAVDASATELLADEGVEFDPASPEYRMFLRQRLAMEIKRTEIEKRRLEGDYSDVLPEVQPAPVPALNSAGPSMGPPTTAGTTQGRTEGLREAFTTFRGEWSRANRREKTLDQYRQSLEIFVSLFGNLRCCDLNFDHGVGLKEKLFEIPADYRSHRKLRALPIPEIVERRLVTKGQLGLSIKTLNRHLGALCTFGKWLAKNRYLSIAANPFAGLFLPMDSDPREERDKHDLSDLRRMFLSPVWVGCQSRGRRAQPGPYIFKDAKFFVPLLGLYGGLRLEEACQLLRTDIKCNDGIWYVDVRAEKAPRRSDRRNGRKQLKNKNSARLVPIHPILLDLGFIEHVQSGSALVVFPELSRANKYQRAGAGFTQWFGRYRRDVGCRERFKDFHSLRHTFISAAMDEGVDRFIVEALDGHSPTGETRKRYHKGYPLRVLYEAVCNVGFGIEDDLKSAAAAVCSADIHTGACDTVEVLPLLGGALIGPSQKSR
jgi:integrase